MDMKHFLVALTMLAALGLPAEAAAQKHRHTPRTAAVAQQQPADTSAIEAFSDTMGVDTDTTASAQSPTFQMAIDQDDIDDIKDSFGEIGSSFLFVICIVAIVCLFSPLAIIGVICYFFYKSRKQKLKLAEMAIKNGQPIPQDLRNDKPRTPEQYWQSGIKKVAIGLGLVVLFAVGFDSWALASIGIVVAIYGAGQLVIAKTTAKEKYGSEERNGSTDLSDNDFEN